MRKAATILLTLLAASSAWIGVPFSTPDVLKVGDFSSAEPGAGLPAGWKPLFFRNIGRHTDYSLVKEDGSVVVKAFAEDSASGLIREVSIDPTKFPVIRWEWKIRGTLKRSDLRSKQGDDYPARVYVTFAVEARGFFGQLKDKAIELIYGRTPPSAAVNYIWALREPVGTIVPNAYTDRAMMFVIESGGDKAGRWVREERHVFKDFERAFNRSPLKITGVAIMTDTDNTGESATAYYGDIVFKKTAGEE